MKDKESIINTLEILTQHGHPNLDSVHWVDVGTDKYLSFFEKEILKSLIFKGGSTCRFFEGSYGSGKTHLLQLLHRSALKEGMVVVHTNLNHTDNSDWQVITKLILKDMEANINGEVIRSLPEILAAACSSKMFNSKIIKKGNFPHPGFYQAMQYATRIPDSNPKAWSILRKYLLGEKVKVADFNKHGLTGIKNPLSSRNAEYVLKTILSGLYALGFPGTLLLFDETEKTLSASSRGPSIKMKTFANQIRRLIDSCSNGQLIGTVIVFAVLPGFLQDCTLSYQALGQRIRIERDISQPVWRSPVMPIEHVNTVNTPQEFLEQCIHKFESIVKQLDGNYPDFEHNAIRTGKRILSENAGLSYKRDLIKALAGLALYEVDN